jgi:hypothetical protein
VLKPLIGSLKGGIAQPVQWTDEKRAAFVAAKQLLTDATCLAHPRADAEIQLVVGQYCNNHQRGFQPLAFCSKKLDAAQMHYSTFDSELLACHEAVRHFKWFLDEENFTLQQTTNRSPMHWLKRQMHGLGGSSASCPYWPSSQQKSDM